MAALICHSTLQRQDIHWTWNIQCQYGQGDLSLQRLVDVDKETYLYCKRCRNVCGLSKVLQRWYVHEKQIVMPVRTMRWTKSTVRQHSQGDESLVEFCLNLDWGSLSRHRVTSKALSDSAWKRSSPGQEGVTAITQQRYASYFLTCNLEWGRVREVARHTCTSPTNRPVKKKCSKECWRSIRRPWRPPNIDERRWKIWWLLDF